LAERAERLAAKRAATGPVMGKKCDHCARRIVVEDQGGRCEECSAPVHWDCMKEHTAAAHRASKDAYR
jgi:hypothetical protein